ncbi:receptor-like protein EIX1 [Salvia divinorum]|uniref:Receptor-like protein EIX1 n=1 Tax=Salvia divinorum TaxID=28513 RepID=A0ABD1HGW0_SALDI
MISDKTIAIKYLLLLLFCVFVSGDARVRCIESEREALLSFKNGLIDTDGILSSWRNEECCKWYGVECSNTTGHVIALRLDVYDRKLASPRNLRGKIGPSLLELHHLNHLDLSHNDFGGNPIPEFIGSMKQLQHLNLSWSNFSGSIPPRLGNLTNLRSLDLTANDFGGNPIPEFIGSMKQLQDLFLRFSNLSGAIPPHLGNLTNLRSLNLNDNDFETIPLLLGNLTNLRSLDLGWNDFGGIQIPEFIGSMKELQHLSLHLSNFSGIVPPQLGNLTHLRSLDLSGNYLRSIFPFIHGSVLETLVLYYNHFTGSMPDLRGLPSLTELNLRGNNFTGSIPLNIGQLSRLQVLDLSHNSLEGVASESHFSKLDKLKSLDLSFNSLILDIAPNWSPPFQLKIMRLGRCNVGPYFPKWLQTQTNLTYLNLDGANIADEAPWWLGSMFSRLEELSLSDNRISGTIQNLSSTFIWYLDLSYNQFSGPIPLLPPYADAIFLGGNMFSGSVSSICSTRHPDLQYLDLSNNQLAGELPNCWEKMSELEYLNLANNSFSGEIPRSLGSLHNLNILQMHGSGFSGELPSGLRHCQELSLLDVGGNKLTGEVPTWIGQLYQMQFLNFRENKLHGSVPPEICNLTNIQVLDLSINDLSSMIPDCFNNFTVLASKNITYAGSVIFGGNGNLDYEYSSFQWKGKESEYRKNLGLLKLIDLSSNRLIGNIPKSFSNMSHLRSLNLSRNSLTGHIIPDIGRMEMLDSLDLSHNQLSGKIPTSLAEIHTLGVLDLSNNNLAGKIPTGTQLQSFNASAYANNGGLCGEPLAKCPRDSLRPSTTNPVENMNEKDGDNFSFMQEVGISLAFGFIFGFWGVVGSFILKKSWRIAFFNLFDAAGDWFYVKIVLFLSKCKRSWNAEMQR